MVWIGQIKAFIPKGGLIMDVRPSMKETSIWNAIMCPLLCSWSGPTRWRQTSVTTQLTRTPLKPDLYQQKKELKSTIHEQHGWYLHETTIQLLPCLTWSSPRPWASPTRHHLCICRRLCCSKRQVFTKRPCLGLTSSGFAQLGFGALLSDSLARVKLPFKLSSIFLAAFVCSAVRFWMAVGCVMCPNFGKLSHCLFLTFGIRAWWRWSSANHNDQSKTNKPLAEVKIIFQALQVRGLAYGLGQIMRNRFKHIFKTNPLQNPSQQLKGTNKSKVYSKPM